MITGTDLHKSFNTHRVLGGLNISVEAGSICAILGPSGCGKSTLLNLISGVDRPDSGNVFVSSRPGYAMQEPHLVPWRTLGDNASLGIEVVRGIRASKTSVIKYFRDFEMESAMDIYPAEASGGMKQRAALIRTLAIEPRILLLDEPFASLDYDIKLKVQQLILAFHEKVSATIILVTHDIEDAIALADTVVIFSEIPARIKAEIPIELGISRRDPVEARKSDRFRDYFVRIWGELKYLDGRDGD